MSAYFILETTLKEILSVVAPLQDDWLLRLQIIAELRAVVASVENLRGATVEPFGSFVSNLFSRWGDLDISIDLPNSSYISYAGKKRKQSLLLDVLRVLRLKGGWGKMQCIPNARVPILKLNRQNISCDISIDNLQGQMKSRILYWICEIDWRFREMVLLVKEWAKAHDINNPRAGTFNSYSLSLLVIFHLQSCVPAILPPLKDIYPENMVDDLKGVKADAEKLVAETCAANIARFRADKFRKINRSSLSELLVSFFAKFSSINMITSEHGLCPFTGQWEAISSNMRWMPKTFAIFIEDPFEQPENTARSVSTSQLTMISQAFRMTHSRLISVYYDKSYVLTTLVRPQVSQFIARTPTNNPRYYAVQQRENSSLRSNTPAKPKTRPQVRKTVNTPSLVPQFQSMRLESNNDNVSMQRPTQPRHGRGQQIWRQKV